MYGKITKQKGDRQFARCVEGYSKGRPLLDEEMRAVPFPGIMFWIFCLGFAVENFDDWSNSFLSMRYLKERVWFIQRFAGMYCQF